MLFDQGKLEKMTIRAFRPLTDPKAAPQVSDSPKDSYVVQVNPSSYTLNHVLKYSNKQGQGFSSRDATYNSSDPVTLQFEFLFDGTGVVPAPSELGGIPLVGAIASALAGSKPYDVMAEIQKFNSLVYDYQGKEHRPRYLLLVWGTLVFPCVLKSVGYRFPLFKPDGTPLRAVATCSFSESLPNAEGMLKNNSSSPDLTHLRDVQEGDTLPLLAYSVYGKAELYLEVARVNRLVNFRRLRAGQRVALPPMAKDARR